MSEFQYYEFVAIDRPPSATERKRLRGITSRATITSTRLVNKWGDFKADPRELVAKHFDAFLYCANWGTRRLLLRAPTTQLDMKIARQYCAVRTIRTGGARSVATVTSAGANLTIDLWSESESGDNLDDIEPGLLSALVPIRNELMAGDYRAFDLGWKLRAQAGEISGRAPPVPTGIRRLTRSQQALAEFLRVDPS